MSLLFWRKTEDTGKYRPDGQLVTEDVAATVEEPIPVQIIHPDGNDYPPVILLNEYLPPVRGQLIERVYEVPGIGTASAYTAGDAFGTVITVHNVFRPEERSGAVVKLVFLDLDDEGKQKDCVFYNRSVTTTADNDAYAPSDDDILYGQGVVSITSFQNWSNNQVGTWSGTFWAKSSDTNLYVRLVTQGADNIAAGALPRLLVQVIPN